MKICVYGREDARQNDGRTWPDGSIEYDAIEAGQVDERGRQCVLRRRHEIGVDGVDRVAGGSARAVAWVLDTRSLVTAEAS